MSKTETIYRFKNEYGEMTEDLRAYSKNVPSDWVDQYNEVAPDGYEVNTFDTFGGNAFTILNSVCSLNGIGVSFWKDMTIPQFGRNLNIVIKALEA